jgi:hypothetical protein
MQQVIDLVVFLISNILLIVWCVFVFRNKTERTLALRLSKKQFLTLIIIEVILFLIMYANYNAHANSDVADSFSWHYSIMYARGVLPLAGLVSLNDKIFGLKDPVFLTLLMCLIVDYFVLFCFTKIADAIKK